MTREKTLVEVLANFIPTKAVTQGGKKTKKAISQWVSEEIKVEYDRLQREHNRECGKGLQELTEAYIKAFGASRQSRTG